MIGISYKSGKTIQEMIRNNSELLVSISTEGEGICRSRGMIGSDSHVIWTVHHSNGICKHLSHLFKVDPSYHVGRVGNHVLTQPIIYIH